MKRRILVLALLACVGIAVSATGQGKKTDPSRDKSKDPVCGLFVERDPDLSATHNGVVHYFCSKTDRDSFNKAPERYLKKR
jgi:YHS domain-containing protein